MLKVVVHHKKAIVVGNCPHIGPDKDYLAVSYQKEE